MPPGCNDPCLACGFLVLPGAKKTLPIVQNAPRLQRSLSGMRLPCAAGCKDSDSVRNAVILVKIGFFAALDSVGTRLPVSTLT